MKRYEIYKLLNDSTVSVFVARKWIEINDLLAGQYFVNMNIQFKTPTLKSNWCEYSNAYIVVIVAKDLLATNEYDKAQKNATFKNNAPFRSCI